MFVEPEDHTIAKIQFIAVAVVREMPCIFIFGVFDLLPEPSKSHKYLVTQKRCDRLILRSMHNQQRRLNPVKIKNRRILDISISKLPRCAPYCIQVLLHDADSVSCSVLVHLAVETHKIRHPVNLNGSLESRCLNDQGQRAVSSGAMSHDS